MINVYEREIFMKLLFKQKMFSWFDSYTIYNENNDPVYEVQGKLDWGHCLHIYDQNENFIGCVKEEVLTFLPKFAMYIGEEYIGQIKKELTFFKPTFTIDCNDWSVEGEIFEWDYQIVNSQGELIANISKEIFNWTDTYVIDIVDSQDALHVLMVVLAIDAEKCSRN